MIHCSVIIPHMNQEKHLQRCLEALCGQTLDKNAYEVIVIDNGSKKDVSHLVKEYGFDYYIYDKNQNPYTCRNLGIQKARGEILCFLDAKCLPVKGWLKSGLAAIAHADLIGGHYEVDLDSSSLLSKIFPLMYLNNEKNISNGKGVSVGNLFVRKAVFDKIGLFKTTYFSGNDILFTEEAIRQGFRLNYSSSTVVHYPPKSFGKLKNDAFKYGTGSYLTGQKSLLDSLRFWMPMKIDTFFKTIKFREYQLSKVDLIRAWFLIWRIKIQFALGILKGTFSRN